MEHLDLAGVIATPSSWTMPAFDQQDAIFLSTSRQMLEPILEETSEDEEHAQNSWNQYENSTSFWSSAESETGSVIRIEVNKDPDSISERDFACPAKRARRSEEFLIGGPTTQQQSQHLQVPTIVATNSSLDDTVLLRRHQRYAECNETNSSLERFLAYEACSRDSLGASSQPRSSTGSRRFDDFYSDSDSLSYHSLSRSSSLIQFESLERQLLDQHVSMNSLGNSSPSLLSFDGANTTSDDGARSGGNNSGSNSGNNSRRGSQSSLLKRFETSDGRLHQTYLDLDKLNFDDEANGLFGASKSNLVEATIGEIKSDSESSTSSSGSSSGNSILTASKPSAEDLTDSSGVVTLKTARITAFQRVGKSSAENLSEDSGYGEPSILRRSKSKSIPKNFEKFCEEDEEFQQYEHETHHDDDDEDADEEDVSQNTHSKNSTVIHYGDEDDICQPKINDATFIVESSETSFNEPTTPPLAALRPESPPTSSCQCRYDTVKNSPARETILEQRRSLAHSPSPVSSDASGSSSRTTRSSTSASTCASAASFTWLPIQQQQQSRTEPKQTLGEFCSTLRNSLPDIRDALSSEAYFSYSIPQVIEVNGYVLEQSKAQAVVDAREAEDSDISTSSASAHNDSRSDETDYAETTPETKKRSVGGSSGVRSGGGVAGGGGYSNRARISSVPNELDKLGRRTKRSTKSKYSKSSTESSSNSSAEEDDFFDDSCLKIRRSCSWSERRERNLQKFEKFAGRGDNRVEPQSLGYMNASYHNLTLLDYSSNKPNTKHQVNLKRCSDTMEPRNSSGDYESVICKGNFLLDELSEIYDKNASILNDKPMDNSEKVLVEEEVFQIPMSVLEKLELELEAQPQQCSSPKPPPRQRKHSNSSYSDVDGVVGENEVQHVQLTIRKPPARQKHGRKSEATNSLTSEAPTFGTFGKTFDQDPTNLRTSYAQSLEKCNFDPKEISNTDLAKVTALPKRRFQTQAVTAKKRNLVSSTPNLNAFDPRGDEIEDDMYVSSAHTSMHQLPQTSTQKPLGILLPAGSRTSFGKEVSFCPVVSKYSWQEQSSEECNEPVSEVQAVRQDSREEEDTDDELLDNADATVIYNTKENELIATRYNEEQPTPSADTDKSEMVVVQVEEQPQQSESVRATLIIKENAGDVIRSSEESKTSNEIEAQRETPKLVSSELAPNVAVVLPVPVSNGAGEVREVSLKPTIVDAATLGKNSNRNTANPQNGHTTTRPLSIQLPILSEPPTNRAHHILYASQQMLDNFQRRERDYSDNLDYGGASGSVQEIKAHSVNNLNFGPHNTMSNYSVKGGSEHEAIGGGGVQPKAGKNNNNELMKSKFKGDEKHPSSKGFLTRFANGFRFSLRRNKKKQLQQQKEQQLAEQQQQQQNGSMGKESSKDKSASKSTKTPANGLQKSGNQNSPDFIYIPLKGPLPAGSRAVNTSSSPPVKANGNSSSKHNESGYSIEDSNGSTASANSGAKSPGNQQTMSQTSTLKVTGKPPLPKLPPRTVSLQSAGAPHAQYHHPNMALTATNFVTLQQQQQQQQQQQPTSQFYTNFLDTERSYYYDDFQNQLNSGMQANGCAATDAGASAGAGGATSEFASPSRASVSQKTQMFNNMLAGVGGGPVGGNGRVAPKNTNNCKIGLIETNLDTHETVISGKTRSLMDIGPQQQSRFKYGKRLNVTAAAAGGDDDDDYDDDDVYGEDMGRMADDGSVVVKSNQQGGGGQIASVRRPHKSMEFLLDKENQKNVLVCTS